MGSGAAAQLQKESVDYTTSLFDEGIMNDQFTQINSLQDESNPKFVAEVVNVFFKDSQRLLDETEKLLTQSVDYHKLDANEHQLKGNSSRHCSNHMTSKTTWLSFTFGFTQATLKYLLAKHTLTSIGTSSMKWIRRRRTLI
ncbi:Histidine-containing phosphotransfer protein 3 [Bienertia sinuspersici]